MKLGLLISLFLHSLVLILALSVPKTERKAQGEEETMSVDLTEGELNGQQEEINVKEVGPGEGEEPTNFYWGLGLKISYDFRGLEIVEIYPGYTAESSGLQVGDIIVLINGLPSGSGNDIKGDGPKKLILTILRNGARIQILTERCKVYY